jgi:hypothetical protein
MRVGIGVIARRPQFPFAELTITTCDGERNDNPVSTSQIRDFFSSLFNNTHELVAKDVALFHRWNKAVE